MLSAWHRGNAEIPWFVGLSRERRRWHELRKALLVRPMNRLIRIAWRTFWVGLGASAVLIGQTVIAARAPDAPAHADPPASTLIVQPPPPPPNVAYLPRT